MKKVAMFIYRICLPIIDPIKVIRFPRTIINYFIFFVDYMKYKKRSKENVSFLNIYPCLHDKNSQSQSGKGEYFYQDVWAVREIVKSGVKKHIDIGSRIDGFAAFLSCFINVDYIDIRKPECKLKNFNEIEGSILSLPYDDSAIESLSSLHVLEHIGLGRYGDPIDPNGTEKAVKEMSRVLKKGGKLYIGVPCGTARVEYNANRVFDPDKIVGLFNNENLELINFSIVKNNTLIEECSLNDFKGTWYYLGMFVFTK